MKQRTAPRSSADRLVPHDLVDLETVTVVCSVTGDRRSNAGVTSSEWYRIENGAYLPSVYVQLSSAAGLRTCT